MILHSPVVAFRAATRLAVPWNAMVGLVSVEARRPPSTRATTTDSSEDRRPSSTGKTVWSKTPSWLTKANTPRKRGERVPLCSNHLPQPLRSPLFHAYFPPPFSLCMHATMFSLLPPTHNNVYSIKPVLVGGRTGTDCGPVCLLGGYCTRYLDMDVAARQRLIKAQRASFLLQPLLIDLLSRRALGRVSWRRWWGPACCTE